MIQSSRLLLTALFLGTTALVGCAEQTPELFIRGNVPLSDSCEAPSGASASGAVRGRGTLDILVSELLRANPSYEVSLLVENTMVNSEAVGFGGGGGGAGGGGLAGNTWEANTVSLESAQIRVTVPDGAGIVIPRAYEIPLSGSVDVSGGSAVISMAVLNSSVIQRLTLSPLLRSGEVVPVQLRVTVSGQTIAGRSVDSNEFVYPLDICYGCLVNFPPDAIDTEISNFNCRRTVSENVFGEVVGIDDGVCRIGQDDFVDCRSVCPQLSLLEDEEIEVVQDIQDVCGY